MTDEITIFDLKYNEGLERLNNLISSETVTNSIKNYVERYKLDKSRENRLNKKNDNTNKTSNLFKDEKRKQIVDIYEIRNHDKKVQQLLNKNYLKNEIEWFKIKKREDEHKNKYNYNKPKYEFENEFSMNNQVNNKEIIRNNNIKKKKFSNLANKVNIDKFMQIKKLNEEHNSYSVKKNREENTYNNTNENKDGVFIPYSEYKQFGNNNNRTIKINMKQYNINKKYNKLNININNIDNIKNLRDYNSNSNLKNYFSENNNKNLNMKNNNSNKNIYSNPTNQRINNISHSQENKKRKNKIVPPIELDKRYKIDKRIPLEKKIDYLREKKTSPEQRVKILKMYKSNNIAKDKKNGSPLDDIKMLNLQAKKYEDKAKMQEQLMKVKGYKKYGNEDNVKLSNLLIDSISTKLAILNQISSNEN